MLRELKKEFQNDLKDNIVRVLQIDFAMSYQYELKRGAMGAI